jgi:hypothetical protein
MEDKGLPVVLSPQASDTWREALAKVYAFLLESEAGGASEKEESDGD